MHQPKIDSHTLINTNVDFKAAAGGARGHRRAEIKACTTKGENVFGGPWTKCREGVGGIKKKKVSSISSALYGFVCLS